MDESLPALLSAAICSGAPPGGRWPFRWRAGSDASPGTAWATR